MGGSKGQCAQVGSDLDLRARKKVTMSAYDESDSEQTSEKEAGDCAPGPPASECSMRHTHAQSTHTVRRVQGTQRQEVLIWVVPRTMLMSP